jgi:hypothetical protein
MDEAAQWEIEVYGRAILLTGYENIPVRCGSSSPTSQWSVHECSSIWLTLDPVTLRAPC